MNLKQKAVLSMIALAASAGAQAQSNVTLYGVIDTGIEYANNQPGGGHDVVRLTTANVAGSRWGLRGVEDLGGGLKGLFVLESGFESDTGKSSQGGRLFGRAAYVGLKNEWGEVLIGRQNGPIFDVAGSIDPMFIVPRYSLLAQDAQFAARADNTIKYVGAFGPVKTSAMYSFGADSGKVGGSEVPGQPKLGREFGGNIVYSANNLSITAAYDELNSGTVTVTPDATTRRATLAGTYAFGKATVYAGYRWGKAYGGALLPGAPAQSNQRSNLWWTGARWNVVGALTLAAAAYYQDFSGTNADPWLFVGSADYEFSKRTDAYLTVGYAKNRHGSNLGIGSGSWGFGTVQPGANQVGVVVGLRHKF
ncbi:porin [Cupriavidus basilensis]|uniref:Porin n=1 Tax=Cupriavidus basilensis TaxID=68895 RepID=A0ABT6AVN4_9BURK|nr:porin [Cupriavidus basilensis]MDF3836689.1 porin [Cupriavidus basilensis]